MTKSPNFLIIVADDLGWSDVGAFGSEINTPNLDTLAKEGLRFTDFHTASACSPTRSMLLSGTDNHLAGLGQMAEFASRMHQWDDYPGYEGYLNWRVAALPEILKEKYDNIISGKWHLGLTKETSPSARGFEKVFSLLPGAGHHYKDYKPSDDTYKEKGDDLKKLLPSLYMSGNEFIDADKELPEDFYSSDYFTTKLEGFLNEHYSKDKDRPFFAYLPFTAPHWPLQAPRQLIEKYAGRYNQGPDALRLSRLKKQENLGLYSSIRDGPPAEVSTGDEKEWSEMREEERKFSSKTMEVYAAMVERLDWNVGRIIQYLKEKGEYDNTFVLFMSDNGAEGAILENVPLRGGKVSDIIRQRYDNSLDNLGNRNSFTWYGPRWALAATAPSRDFKSYISEGGIRCPLIVRFPPIIQNPGSISHTFTTVMDITPTVLELAGIEHPYPRYAERDVLPVRGKSWVKHLATGTSVYNEELDFTGWELFGQRAIRRGPWKAIYVPVSSAFFYLSQKLRDGRRGDSKWKLYNIKEDRAESNDLSESRPDILQELINYWTLYVSETGLIPVIEN
ncbi:arylsulfatase [Schizosaccharomyces cryophilus OY26]|uniref:Arylsulfatase n=1 Tax=Schizosaccharomyces cryophilus (strain OY26 / ATCC MYA-4695 / CBS 11777 / NBRC 106824 / NRRL Y48691) TaxID=653667 RepID=S9W183_SCHCR|nr:arylsulfatase [Schizosaccharomyces cryophilus OY26]EPY52289.1 arylsulfatase [Schizosaccharomyces cryophilus OY26]